MARGIIALFLVALVAMTAVFGFQAVFAEAGDDRIAVNETFTPGNSGVVQLEHSDRTGVYYGNETTVYNASDDEMDRGTDYDWNDTNGTLDVLAGGDLSGDSEGSATYEYQVTTAEQRSLLRILAIMPEVVGWLLPLLGLLAFIVIMRGY